MTDKEKLEAIIAELRRLKKVRGVYKDIYKDIFAFYNSLPSVPVSEDLEEAARKYLKSLKDDCFIDSDILLAFKAGANWQKQQLTKAVKVKISNASIVSLPVNCDLKVGDKVLIIKED